MNEQIEQTLTRLTAFISQNYVDVDVSPGSVIHELVLKLAASLQNEQYNLVNSISQAKSIKQVLEADSDTYSLAMDMVASNYNVSRSTGKRSAGNLKITVAAEGNYTIPKSVQFIQPALGLVYTISKNYFISPNPDLAGGELKLKQEGNFYYFILPVEAAEVGSQYQVSSGVAFSVLAPSSIYGFVGALAYGSFTSGLPVDSDKTLVSKIKTSLGSRRFESAAGIANRLRDQFETFQSLSVCGANDLELTRSKDNVFGISTFGKADVYVRTSTGPEVLVVEMDVSKIGEDLWEMNIDNSSCAGFYRVISILPVLPDISQAGTLTVTSTVYNYRKFPDFRNNEINNFLDARFTKYQTAKVRFNYTQGSTEEKVAVGGTAKFTVAVSYQPHIGEIQDLLLSDTERFACADYLVKAVMPCFVSLKLDLVRKKSSDDYDSLKLNNLKKDIFNYINTIPFGEDLYASKLIDICHNYNIARVNLPTTITGNILCNDGTVKLIETSDVLAIPTDIAKGVSKKTTLFFIDYYRTGAGEGVNVLDNIGINLL